STNLPVLSNLLLSWRPATPPSRQDGHQGQECMPDPTPTVSAALAKAFRDYRDRVHRLATDVPDARFWARPYPYGNSMGHLTLHLTGNLNFYVGREMAGTGYVRDREREFHEAAPPSK